MKKDIFQSKRMGKRYCKVMAKEDNIELSDDHWEIINFSREYYEEYQIAPALGINKGSRKKIRKR